MPGCRSKLHLPARLPAAHELTYGREERIDFGSLANLSRLVRLERLARDLVPVALRPPVSRGLPLSVPYVPVMSYAISFVEEDLKKILVLPIIDNGSALLTKTQVPEPGDRQLSEV